MKKRKGYTLTELVLVMVLISILAVGTIIGVSSYVNKARDTGVDNDLKSINVTIDYLKEFKGRLPNIAEVKEAMGQHGYKFNLKTALVSEVDGEQYITIRAESTQMSKYNIPYALTVVAKYNDEYGPKADGDTVDVTSNETSLLKFSPSSITMLVLDNTPSGVPEVFWVN